MDQRTDEEEDEEDEAFALSFIEHNHKLKSKSKSKFDLRLSGRSCFLSTGGALPSSSSSVGPSQLNMYESQLRCLPVISFASSVRFSSVMSSTRMGRTTTNAWIFPASPDAANPPERNAYTAAVGKVP